MLVPTTVVADRNPAVVPTRRADVLLRYDSHLFRARPCRLGKKTVLVLFPIPVGRKFKHGSQALLSLPQRPNWIFGALGFATLTYSHGAFFPSGATLERRILR